MEMDVVQHRVVPDNVEVIAGALCHGADVLRADLLITTGGTGLGPRDVTPEATLKVIDRQAIGIAEAIRAVNLQGNPLAMLSRGVAGLRGRTLIINLPGSPRAVSESLEVLRPVLKHALAIVAGAAH
jgi:molybdenum cofactor synthesis domain-containing protein